MPKSEEPTAGDIASVLHHAADVLTRKAEIANQIAALRAEDARLDIEIRATWETRVDEMRAMLKGFLKRIPPKPELPPDPVPEEVPPIEAVRVVTASDSGSAADGIPPVADDGGVISDG